MKVIFLDIDGVLNSQRTAVAFGRIPFSTANDGRAALDEVAIRIIGGIARASGAVIVLSSTWRKHSDWQKYGPDLDLPIIDRTPTLSGNRGPEIAVWLKLNHEVENYAIIDDDSDMLPEQMPFFVHTSGFDGFTWTNAQLLAKLMGVDLSNVNRPPTSDTRTDAGMEAAFAKHGIENSFISRLIFGIGFRTAQSAHGISYHESEV